jgi:hypothetical protein
MDIPTDHVEGHYGHAERIELTGRPTEAETVCHWIITAPSYHPLWQQYILAVVRLRDGQPGFPEPFHKFAGTTHELLVMAIQPDEGPYTAEQLQGMDAVPYLTPINIAEQFIATDDEMADMAGLAAAAVVHGALCPETADAPDRVRHSWLVSLTKTLAHLRGEVHAE